MRTAQKKLKCNFQSINVQLFKFNWAKLPYVHYNDNRVTKFISNRNADYSHMFTS